MRIKLHILLSTRPLLWLAASFVVLSASIITAPVSHAAGESYSWNGPNAIKMTGSSLQQTANFTVYGDESGSLTASSGNGGVVLHDDSDSYCKITVTIAISSDFKSGTITSATQTQGVSSGGPVSQCSSTETSIFEAWRNTRVNISGNRNSGDESDEQQKVNVVLINPNKKSDSPNKVNFSIESADGKLSTDFDSNIGSDGNYYGTFTNITPGKWKVCVDKIAATKCQTITKVKFLPLTVRFGEGNQSQLIMVIVKFDDTIPVNSTFTIDLKKDGKIIDSKVAKVIGSTDELKFPGMEPGSYQACYKTRCVDDTKKESVQLVMTLSISQADAEEDTTSCAVEGVGWMICPVVKFLGVITDKMYGLLADNLLKVQAGEIFDTGGGTYKAWSTIRNLANVAFVLAFLFVIYSQITGAGLSNYGIKKMLPKIVIAAILVNVSFWVCAVAVDLSNILGYSLKEFFDPSNSSFSYTITADGVTKTGNGWTGLAVAVVATAALVYVGLSVLLPALVVVVLAVLTVVAVLAVRQALIILLIVVSPLAFVAYLLPNTEEWFKKWLSLFKTMLLVFPIISVVFGASALASKVVMDAAQGNVFVSIVGALISIVPLFITPIIMKSAGGVLNRIGGVINNPNKGPFDRLRKGAQGYRTNRQEYRNLKSQNGFRSLPGATGFSRMRSRRQAILGNRKAELNRANSSYVAGLAEQDEGFRGALARGGGSGADMRALANAINTQHDLSSKEVKAASAVIDHLNLSSEQKAQLATGQVVTASNGTRLGGNGERDRDLRLAAQQAVVGSGDAEQINRVVDHMSTLNAGDVGSAKELNNFASALESSSSKPSYIQPADLERMRQNGLEDSSGAVTSVGDSSAMLTQALQDNVYSPAKMTQTGRQEMGIVLSHAQSLPQTDAGRQRLVANAQEVLTDDRLNTSLGKQRSVVESISVLP